MASTDDPESIKLFGTGGTLYIAYVIFIIIYINKIYKYLIEAIILEGIIEPTQFF